MADAHTWMLGGELWVVHTLGMLAGELWGAVTDACRVVIDAY